MGASLGSVQSNTMYIPKLTKACLVSAVLAVSAYAQENSTDSYGNAENSTGGKPDLDLNGDNSAGGKPDFSDFQNDFQGDYSEMEQMPTDHGLTCKSSEGMFGEWIKREDCQCNSEQFKPTKHSCCMRMTQNIMESAVKYWGQPDHFFAITHYNAMLDKKSYMQSNDGARTMYKLKEWMQQYKDMKYRRSPFDVMRTLKLEFMNGGQFDSMVKMYGADEALGFIFAEGEDKIKMDMAAVEEGKDLGILEGSRKLMFTILQSALYDAEDKEKALIEIFRAMRDCKELKERMWLKKQMGEEISHWAIMEMLTREVNYHEELKPIDVVRGVMQMWMMWSMEDEMKDEIATTQESTTADAYTTEDVNTTEDSTTEDSTTEASARKRREADMSEEDIKNFYENNMEMPNPDDMKAYYKMLDIIELAYQNPIEAKFQLLVMMMGGMKKMGADEQSLKWMQYMMVQCFARDVLKKFKCYGYAEAYSWNVIDKKMSMIAEETYDEATFLPIADDFTNSARLPQSEEVVALWASALNNSYGLPPQQHGLWLGMLKDITEGIMKTGLSLDQPLCDVKKGYGFEKMMGGGMGMMGGKGKGGPPKKDGMDWSKYGKGEEGDNMMGMMGMDDDKMGMMMNMKKKMMETKMEMNEKLDNIMNMVTVQKQKKFTLWCQMFDDADEGKFLEMPYANERYCANFFPRFGDNKHMGLKMEACNSSSDAQIDFNFMGNYLVSENKYGKQQCLTATPNKNFGLEAPFAHTVHLTDCELTTPEEDGQAFDGESFQQFAHCPYTGRIHLVGDTEICLHIQETNRGDIKLTTCHCDAGISQAPAFGRRLPEEL